MNTAMLAKEFKMQHRQIMVMARGIIEKGLFSQSEIVWGTYTTKQNKTHECFDIADSVIVYLLSTRRCFRDGTYRLDKCAKLLESMKIKHDIVIGDATRGERKFGVMLDEFFESSIEIIPQHHICGFRLDFYIPSLSIAIEYDEAHHLTKPNAKKDAKRVKAINDYIRDLEDCGDIKWVRVKEGFEIKGIRDLMGLILHEGLESNLGYLGFAG